MRLLVTLCNNQQRPILLAIGDAGVEHMVTKDNFGNLHVGGATGIAKTDGAYTISLQTDPACIAVIDEHFQLVKVVELPMATDLHGIARFEDGFLVASTGTNQVIRLNKDLERASPFWSPSESLVDIDHINDVSTSEGAVLACMFGPRRPDNMRAGKVVDLLKNTVVASGIREPHSVCLFDKSTFVLESIAGDLVEFKKGFYPRRICGICGYARGLLIEHATIVIGRSGYRSNARGTVGDRRPRPFDVMGNPNANQCGIFIIDREGWQSKFIDLTPYGSEIYQILYP